MLHCGDMLAVLPTLAENSFDSCVCDPPYHLQSIHKRFAAKGRDETSERYAAGPYGRTAKGFMGKQWDGGDIAFDPETWAHVYRVLKPGAHLLACGGTRTYHLMASAIDVVGFEIRDCIQWLYGSGFPKSHDVSKALDKSEGGVWRGRVSRALPEQSVAKGIEYERVAKGEPITDVACEWNGWGTALKPACELIVLARKPLSEPTIAANVLKWGTGGLNINGCRIEAGDKGEWPITERRHADVAYTLQPTLTDNSKGRWPANIIHDGSEEVLTLFPDSVDGIAVGGNGNAASIYGSELEKHLAHDIGYGGGGSAARFFYTSKADSDDRLGSKHPTVKPLDLMQYLVRLVTPPRGRILDPFAGTGTTGEAAWREGFSAVLIEREAEYQADIRRRMALALAGPDERARESIKARMNGKPRDDGPLFGGAPIDERGGGRKIYGVFADERLARSD